MPRLFIAIDLPEDLRGNICGLRRNLPGVRWTEKDQIHLTLRFIGDADEENFRRISEGLYSVRFNPFSIEMNSSGFFPSVRRPSVFWLGCAANPELSRLKNDMDEVLELNGLPRETRGFAPHVTIARLKDIDQKETAKLEGIYNGFMPRTFRVDEFILYSSVLTAKGAIHAKERIYSPQNNSSPA